MAEANYDYFIGRNLRRSQVVKSVWGSLVVVLVIFGFFLTYEGGDEKARIGSINAKNGEIYPDIIAPEIKLIENGKLVSIKAKKGDFNYKSGQGVLWDVDFESADGKVTAGKLEISDNRNKFHFSNNPVVEINR